MLKEKGDLSGKEKERHLENIDKTKISNEEYKNNIKIRQVILHQKKFIKRRKE